jgi:hypothetical protein
MTMDDAFDQRLKAAFADAAAPMQRESEADAFMQKVVTRLSSPDRKRVLILGVPARPDRRLPAPSWKACSTRSVLRRRKGCWRMPPS